MSATNDRGGNAGRVRGLLVRAIRWAKGLVPHGMRQRLIAPLGHINAQYEPRPLTIPSNYLKEQAPADGPQISIVVPSLNYGRYLGATLQSISDQEYPNLELVIADGGSTDSTDAVIERFGGLIDRVRKGPDGGQADAINRAHAETSGEIMAWVNADDILLPGALSVVGRFFAANPDVDLVYGNRVLIDEQGDEVGLWVTPPHTVDSLQWFDFVPQETMFWRRDVWEKIGGIDESYDYGFDWDLVLRFQADGAKIVRLPRFLGAFRQHGDQKTRRAREDAQVELERIRRRWHGRPVGLGEAKARSERVLLRATPHHMLHSSGWRLRGGVSIEAAPVDGPGLVQVGGTA